MRETCARALAAALMTGAIATAVGLPSAFESASAPERGLTAPPSSLQRTVRVPADTLGERTHGTQVPAVRPSTRPSRTSGARNVRYVSATRPVARRANSAPTRVAAPKPHPAPVPGPAPTPVEPPVAAPAPAPAPTDTTRELTSTTATPPAAVQPEPPPAPATDEPDRGKDKGNKDKEKEKKDKEHGQGNGKED